MSLHYRQTTGLIFAAVLVAACADTPTPSSTATTAPPTPTAVPATATASSQTASPTSTAIVPSPTTVPATEEAETEPGQDTSPELEANTMQIEIGDRVLTAALADNSSVDALTATLSEGPITVEMRDYGNMEKVGPLGMELPRNDQQITTEAGDIILYQGSALVIYYAPNSWSFTRLGKINDVTPAELREILGEGNVTVMLSLP